MRPWCERQCGGPCGGPCKGPCKGRPWRGGARREGAHLLDGHARRAHLEHELLRLDDRRRLIVKVDIDRPQRACRGRERRAVVPAACAAASLGW
eukprot:1774514-Prymnesium_polylepis.1